MVEQNIHSTILIKKEMMIRKNENDINEIYTFAKGVIFKDFDLSFARNLEVGHMELCTKELIN